jgi:hypothetical protein
MRTAAVAAAAAVLAGVAAAQPGPERESADPIAAVLQDVPPAVEEPPPAPGVVTPNVATPSVPVTVVPPPGSVVEEEDSEESEPEVASPPQETPPAGDPTKRVRHTAAVIQALDKITAETMRFEARVGRPIRYKGLVFTVRACETSAPEEPMRDAAAFMEIRAEPKSQSEQRPSRQVFRGWMFASAPAVHALEHPVYDAWLIGCKAARPRARG